MHNTVEESLALVKELAESISAEEQTEIAVCPPFTALYAVSEMLKSYSHVSLAAQNMHFEEKGAFTGEVSPVMLKELNCKYVIIGHSERREYFGETDETVNKKVKAAFKCGITPIMCVGETLDQREAGETEKHIQKQVREGIKGLSQDEVGQLLIAYEPIWAIGTGRTATAEQANEICELIRVTVAEIYGNDRAEQIRIQYGGSVKGENSKEILGQTHIDGALVGGASLKAETFIPIIQGAK